MIIINHRINTIIELNQIPKSNGVEIDLRDNIDGSIHLQHDPFCIGEKLEDFLVNYKHSFLILNIKSEGIEFKVLSLLKKYNVTDYFFLDSSFPMIIKLINSGEKNIALRYSEFESLGSFIHLRGKVKWAWIDSFGKFSLNKKSYQFLKKNFNLCLVSPELQNNPESIIEFKNIIMNLNFKFDAVCSKKNFSDYWIF